MTYHEYLLSKGWNYRGRDEELYEKEINGITEIMDLHNALQHEREKEGE